MDFEFEIDKKLRDAAPNYTLLALTANVINRPTPDDLWCEIECFIAEISQRYTIGDVRTIPAVTCTRKVYKSLGKDPNRYRPSSDALLRRAVRGLGLYRSLALIDATNLLSMLTGISIGAFDADTIEGSHLCYGVGEAGEPYQGIGRGALNIENMPVWRDALGGFGTPTSDNERTKLTAESTHLLMLINIFHKVDRQEINDIKAQAERLISPFGDSLFWKQL